MSANSSFIGNIELLANGQFSENWVSIGPKSQWDLNPAGELIQKSLVGNKQPGTGAILALKDLVTFPIQELKLSCRPGSQFKVGIIFSLVDEKNFSVFCIDQHNSRTRGYDLLIFDVENGDYNIISKESYSITQPEVATFMLKQAEQNLHFYFNDSLSYTWTDKSLSNKKLGLYSYKNNDAAFLSLSINSLSNSPIPSNTRPMETQPVNTNGNVIQQAVQPTTQVQPVPFDPNGGITGFLNIKKPASKTEIEFTEVFTVPLDSFYSSLYQNSSLDNSNQEVTSGLSEVQLLDLRIKRWYRDLKAVRENLVFAKTDLERKRKKVKEAEDQINQEGLDDDKYSEWEKKLAERRADYHIALRRVNNLRDQEGLILREIRVNGFAVIENTTIDAIQTMGYNFHIVRQGVEPSQYEPVDYKFLTELSDNDLWEKAEDKLHDQLFDSGAITDQKVRELYLKEKYQLAGFDTCLGLVESVDGLRKDIDRLEQLRPSYEQAVNDVNILKEIEAWKADKQKIESSRSSYSDVLKSFGLLKSASPFYELCNPDVYPVNTVNVDGIPVGRLQNTLWAMASNSSQVTSDPLFLPQPDFQRTILSAGKLGWRTKLNRLVFDIGIDMIFTINWGDSGPAIYGLAIGLYSPELGINFFHNFLCSYESSGGFGRQYRLLNRETYGTNQNLF